MLWAIFCPWSEWGEFELGVLCFACEISPVAPLPELRPCKTPRSRDVVLTGGCAGFL